VVSRTTPVWRAALAVALVATVGAVGEAQPTPLDGPGVSQALAAHRVARMHNVRYALSLDLTARDSATGTVTVRFTRRGTLADLWLDFRGRSLTALTINGAAIAPAAHWNGHHIRLPAARLRTGDNVVTAAFTTPIAAAGAAIIRSTDQGDGRDYLYTLLVPADANLLFPCADQPDLKARVALALTTPRDWRALGNGAPVGADTVAATVTHRFAETPPLSSYLIAFAAGPWATITRDAAIRPGERPVPVSLWVRQSRLAEVEGDTLIVQNARALTWLGAWFGVPYAFGKYDALLAPAFPFGGMEHPGAVFYNESAYIWRERPTLAQLRGRQATTYHEVAHQWFGDYLTMRWFDDLWLKEGFATYMAAKMQAALDPAGEPWKSFHLRNKPVAYATDVTAGTTPIWQQLGNLDQAKSNYGPIVYNKAPAVLRQLDWLVGERAFQSGVRALLRANAYGNATWRELLAHVGRAAGRDLTDYGRQWILRPGMPIVEQRLSVRDGRISRLVLTQRPAQPALSGPAPWPLRLRVRLHYPGGRDRLFDVAATTHRTEVVAARGLPAPAYVYANDGDYAYALVLPDSASVGWLERHVGDVPDGLARTMLWGALWDLVREARLPPERYARIALAAAAREPDEELAASLLGRAQSALTRWMALAPHAPLRDSARTALAVIAADRTRPYGVRRAAADGWIDLSATSTQLAQLRDALAGDSLAGLPLRAPLRWAIVTQLVARRADDAASLLARETARDTTSEGRRLAYVARAATPDPAARAARFAEWFADRALNEQWVTSSLRAFHDPSHAAETRPYLRAALDSLPWIQRNRRIFFLGSWLGATLGGQTSAEALAEVDDWLASQPALADDLRRKVLQARDELARVVAVRQRAETTAM
jgi:aminopeptidase N